MAKKSQKEANDAEEKKLKAFLEAYEEVTLKLSQDHGKRMIPILQPSERGILPVFGVENVIVPVPAKKDEESNKPKTVESPDSDNKDTEG